MAGTAERIAVLMIVVVTGVCLDVCKACSVCETPSTPVFYPPKAPPPPMIVEATPPPAARTCPVSLVQLSVCSPLLGGGDTSKSCCALLNLLGLDAEICLCLALDVNILGLITINAKIDVIASIFIDCGCNVPANLSCPS